MLKTGDNYTLKFKCRKRPGGKLFEDFKRFSVGSDGLLILCLIDIQCVSN